MTSDEVRPSGGGCSYGPALPATGGSLLAVLLMALAWAVSRRRR
jgi:acetyl-CoA acetyltransferase